MPSKYIFQQKLFPTFKKTHSCGLSLGGNFEKSTFPPKKLYNIDHVCTKFSTHQPKYNLKTIKNVPIKQTNSKLSSKQVQFLTSKQKNVSDQIFNSNFCRDDQRLRSFGRRRHSTYVGSAVATSCSGTSLRTA